MIPAAQIPETVVTKGADQLFNYGVLGVVCVVLMALLWWFIRQHVKCMEAQAERQGALATVIEANRASNDKVADVLTDVARRLEALERKP